MAAHWYLTHLSLLIPEHLAPPFTTCKLPILVSQGIPELRSVLDKCQLPHNTASRAADCQPWGATAKELSVVFVFWGDEGVEKKNMETYCGGYSCPSFNEVKVAFCTVILFASACGDGHKVFHKPHWFVKSVSSFYSGV